jgi:hypothetical protein
MMASKDVTARSKLALSMQAKSKSVDGPRCKNKTIMGSVDATKQDEEQLGIT